MKSNRVKLDIAVSEKLVETAILKVIRKRPAFKLNREFDYPYWILGSVRFGFSRVSLKDVRSELRRIAKGSIYDDLDKAPMTITYQVEYVFGRGAEFPEPEKALANRILRDKRI